MRLIVATLVSLALFASLPRAAFAEEVVASRAEVETPHEPASEPVQDGGATSLSAQEIVIGTAVVGGAFAIGLIAGGSLATGIVAASVVAISYSVLP